MDSLNINSLAFIRICVDLERRAGIDLTETESIGKPETFGDLLDLAEILAGGRSA